MPPCENVLMKKIFRTKILTAIIKNARDQTIDIDLTTGWRINENNKLEIEYFSGSTYPENITEETTDSNSDDENDYISESDDSDICDSEDN